MQRGSLKHHGPDSISCPEIKAQHPERYLIVHLIRLGARNTTTGPQQRTPLMVMEGWSCRGVNQSFSSRRKQEWRQRERDWQYIITKGVQESWQWCQMCFLVWVSTKNFELNISDHRDKKLPQAWFFNLKAKMRQYKHKYVHSCIFKRKNTPRFGLEEVSPPPHTHQKETCF